MTAKEASKQLIEQAKRDAVLTIPWSWATWETSIEQTILFYARERMEEVEGLKIRARNLIDAIPPIPNIDLSASINQMLEALSRKEE